MCGPMIPTAMLKALPVDLRGLIPASIGLTGQQFYYKLDKLILTYHGSCWSSSIISVKGMSHSLTGCKNLESRKIFIQIQCIFTDVFVTFELLLTVQAVVVPEEWVYLRQASIQAFFEVVLFRNYKTFSSIPTNIYFNTHFLVPLKTQLLEHPCAESSCSCTVVPQVMNPTKAFGGNKLRDITKDSYHNNKLKSLIRNFHILCTLRACKSSSSMHKSITYRNTGGTVACRCRK